MIGMSRYSLIVESQDSSRIPLIDRISDVTRSTFHVPLPVHTILKQWIVNDGDVRVRDRKEAACLIELLGSDGP